MLLVMFPSHTEVSIPWLFMGTQLSIDHTALNLLAPTILIWAIGYIYGKYFYQTQKLTRRFWIFFSLSLSGNLGLFVVADMFSFYLAYALMSFATLGLIVFKGGEFHRRAGRIYISLLILGELLIFSAFILIYDQIGSITFSEFTSFSWQANIEILFIIGFGIKLGMIPFHFGLPLSYCAAPLPACIVMGGAMINAGVLGGLRFLQLGITENDWVGILAICFGVCAIFYAIIIGLKQENCKTILGYSSVSQMGTIIALFGVALIKPEYGDEIAFGIIVYAIHHGLVKGLLFLAIDSVKGWLDQLSFRILFGIAALSLAGAPLTSGMAAKIAVKQSLESFPILIFILGVGAIGTTLIIFHFIRTLWKVQMTVKVDQRKSGLFALWFGLWLVTLIFPWTWQRTQAIMLQGWDAAIWFSLCWPIITGCCIAYYAIKINPGFTLLNKPIPAGDIIVSIEKLSLAAKNSLNLTIENRLEIIRQVSEIFIKFLNMPNTFQKIASFERLFEHWYIVGVCFLATLLIFFSLYNF